MASDLEKIQFANSIFQLMTEKSISSMEAILWFCETHNFEIDIAAQLITPALREMIENDAVKIHMVKATPKLEGI